MINLKNKTIAGLIDSVFQGSPRLSSEEAKIEFAQIKIINIFTNLLTNVIGQGLFRFITASELMGYSNSSFEKVFAEKNDPQNDLMILEKYTENRDLNIRSTDHPSNYENLVILKLYKIDPSRRELLGLLFFYTNIPKEILAQDTDIKNLQALSYIFQNLLIDKEVDKVLSRYRHQILSALNSISGLIYESFSNQVPISEEEYNKSRRLLFDIDRKKSMFLSSMDLALLNKEKFKINDFMQDFFNNNFQDFVHSQENIDRQIEINYELLKDENIEIYCSKNLFSEALFNMIKNSLESFFDQDRDKLIIPKPIINIKLKQKGDKIILSVEDNGIGMKKEHIKKLLHGQGGFSTKVLGHGIGFHDVVMKFIENAQANINISSVEYTGDENIESGTKIKISMPIIITEQSETEY